MARPRASALTDLPSRPAGLASLSLSVWLTACGSSGSPPPPPDPGPPGRVMPAGRLIQNALRGPITHTTVEGWRTHIEGGTVTIQAPAAGGIAPLEYSTRHMQEQLATHDLRAWEGERRTLLLPGGAKLTLHGQAGEILRVSLYDGAESHEIGVLTQTLLHSRVDASVATARDGAEADGEAGSLRLFWAPSSYTPRVDERWGEVCATPEVASRWADRLMSLVRHVHADRRRGQFAFTRAESACYSALFAAGRHEELIALIGIDPRPMWHELLWVGRCKVARGEIDDAIAFMTKAVNPWTPMAGLARFAEGVLLQAGRRSEAYEKYALEANRATTYLATYRLVSKKYPEIDADRLLTDLISTTPGEEGKWFATAKTLKRFDLAMQLAWKPPCDPKTLIRAARDNVGKAPAFAAEVALAALHWICLGRGDELTSLDVRMAYGLATEAGEALGQSERVALRIQTMLKPTTREVRWVREMLSLP